MNPVAAHHRRAVRALTWLVAIASGAVLSLAAAAYIISISDDAGHASIENYHLRTLNITRKVIDELDRLDGYVRVGDTSRMVGILEAIHSRVEELAVLQQQAGDPAQAAALARVQRRFEPLRAVTEISQESSTASLAKSFRLAVTQLEKLHIVRSDQLVREMGADHAREALLLTLVVVTILIVSAGLFAYVYRSLGISLQKQLATEGTLEATEQRLRDSEKLQALGQLVGGIAHDFNNLLMVINGHLELLAQHQALPPSARSGIQEAANAGSRAAGLTKQLLTFARRQPLQRRREDLNALVRSTQELLETLIQDDVDMSITLDPSPMVVDVDSAQVQQLLTNLILNARDAVSRGGKISVATAGVVLEEGDEVEGLTPGRYCRLTIADDGSGMDAQTLSSAFDPFFTTKSVGEGTGLGLSAVHGIVAAHHGVVRLDSEVDRGTRFDIYLPRFDEPALPRQSEPQEPARGGSETLLLVEDERAIRELAATTLSRLGYDVLVAEDGSHAIEISRANPRAIDVIVSDVIMPGMTGPEAVAQILDVQPNATIIYITGYTDDVLLATGLTSSSVLHKPFKLAELAQLIRSSLDGRQSAVA